MRISDDAVRTLVYRSCLALDEEDFAAYLALCAEKMHYRITCYSPEIRRDVILMNHDRAGLAALFDSLPDHIKLPGDLMRHASVYEIKRVRNGTVAEATTIGRPSIMVPYPHATDDHQSSNAHAVDAAGGGWLLPEEAFTPEILAGRLASLLSMPRILENAAAASKAFGRPR